MRAGLCRWRGAKIEIIRTQLCANEVLTIETIFDHQFDMGWGYRIHSPPAPNRSDADAQTDKTLVYKHL